MHRYLAACAAIALLAAAGPSLAQDKTVEPDKLVLPDFPKVNLAPWYEVDPAWPQRPEQFAWAAMPGIAVDKDDNVWTFTRAKPPVQVYSREGKLVRAWGDDFVGSAHHIKLDREGNVWIADIDLHVVRKCSPTGQVMLTLGTPGKKGADASHLHAPTDMTIAKSGDIFVADGYGNNRVVHFDAKGKFVKAWGQMGTGPTDFSLPHAIAIDSQGRLYIADRNNVRIQVYDQAGKLLDSWANVIVPWGFCMTDKDELWVCGSTPMPWREDPKYPGAPLSCPPKDQVVMKFSTAGRVLELWTIPKGDDGKEQPGDVNWIHCLAVDSHGDLYVGDIIGKRAQKLVRKR